MSDVGVRLPVGCHPRINTRSISTFKDFSRIFGLARIRIPGVLLGCVAFLSPLATAWIVAQTNGPTPFGIAWEVQGSWQVQGINGPLLTGTMLLPGSLLQPGSESIHHSITVLLPDGQRIFYECFNAQDCARGFRVPSLYRNPEPFAVDMLARIHTVLLHENGSGDLAIQSSVATDSPLPRDEVVTVLDSGKTVKIAGLAGTLPNGRYTYDVDPLDRAWPSQFHVAVEKKAPYLVVTLPAIGGYVLTISDDLNTPRINVFVSAVSSTKLASVTKLSDEARGLMEAWNREGQGWPIHDFHRAFLISLIRGNSSMGEERRINPPERAAQPRQTTGSGKPIAAVAAEPTFTPAPGLFNGDTAVRLRCATSNAVLHYSIDGSQPTANSPVYSAPIMVKGTALTIKAYASATGKKDSAVVTGIFRIRE